MLEYRLLGPLEVLHDGASIDVGGPRQQVVLAMLLAEPGRVVTIDRLVDAVWGESPPATARSQIQICISALRRLLPPTDGGPIRTRGPGYLLDLGTDVLDAARAAELAARARHAAGAGEPEAAVTAYREALALWRGDPLHGQAAMSTALRDHAVHLAERRSVLLGECVELELGLGRDAGLVGDLRAEVDRDPLREDLRRQLMLALYQAGRPGEALAQYRVARAVSIDELGLEPSDKLQQLEAAILRQEPVPGGEPLAVTGGSGLPGAGPGRSVPRLLPMAVGDFTAREPELAQVVDRLRPGSGSSPVVVLTGRGGVGKSSLAVQAAHLLSSDYPDGQLYADLHGAGTGRTGAERVLERFLRAMGVPASAVPEDPDERAELYRNQLAGRQVLICLDDVVSEGQIGPLLPGTPGCAVVMTSRRRLTALPGALRVELDAFPPEASLRLLSAVIGAERVAADPDGAADLVRRCGNLPLAVRIAAARLAARPHWTPSYLVTRLQNESAQLDELQYGELAVRASVRLTYDTLPPDAQRLFRLLGLFDAPDVGGWIAAPLLEVPSMTGLDLLEDLVDLHLLDVRIIGKTPRYRFHELVRAFARERASAEETTADRTAALNRGLGALLHLAREAHALEYGGDHLIVHGDAVPYRLDPMLTEAVLVEPLDWFERERGALGTAVAQAAALGSTALAWELALCAVTGFEAHTFLDDWRDTHAVALHGARASGDRLGEAAMLYSLGSLAVLENRTGEADGLLRDALERFERLGSPTGAALVLRNLAFLDALTGDAPSARRRGEGALQIFREVRDPVGTAHVLRNLAQLDLDEDRGADALAKLDEAAEICRALGNRRMSAQVQHRLGTALLARGELDRAAEAFRTVLDLVVLTADRIGEAYALLGAGQVEMARADPAGARTHFARAEALAAETGEQRIRGQVELASAEAALAAGDPAEAVVRAEAAATRFRELAAPRWAERAEQVLIDARSTTRVDVPSPRDANDVSRPHSR